MKKSFALFAALALALGAAIFAQEAPKAGAIGITGSVGTSDASIGAWINLTDKIVLLPSVGVTYGYTPAGTTTTTTGTTDLSFSLAGLYEFPLATGLLLGVGPTATYTNNGSDTTTTTPPTLKTETKINTGLFKVGALASVQYFFAKSVGLYLEAGLGASFSHSTQDITTTNAGVVSTTSTSVPSTMTIGLNTAALGIVFLLK